MAARFKKNQSYKRREIFGEQPEVFSEKDIERDWFDLDIVGKSVHEVEVKVEPHDEKYSGGFHKNQAGTR